MKRLLNTLYVLSSDAYLSLDGENIVVNYADGRIARMPFVNLENIVSFSYKLASPALIGACLERNTGMCFYSPQGRFLFRAVGKENGNVLLRQEQYRISDDLTRSLAYGKNFIIGKVYNSRWVLERVTRDHPLRVPVEEIKKASSDMREILNDVSECEDLQNLLGLEGKASQIYFGQFDKMILQQKDDFPFSSRNRRPPLDNVNALLSFAYSILASECANALTSVGLDPYVGFMHRIRPGRKSLALDLMEELRSVFADRFVLSGINQRIFNSGHFDRMENGAVLLNDEGRRQFLKAWQNKKQEQILHPFLNEKIEWGLVPYAQSMLLARSIRGDIDSYPPFFWK